MRAPLSWLRDFAPIDGDVADLVASLDDLGLIVEGVEPVGEGLDRVVVCRVLEVDAIEGADRIRRVLVDAGTEQLQIVCGAFNFGAGDLVPLARVGTVLPNGTEIGRRKMKGVESNGMLCSGAELRLSDDGEGLLVLTGAGGAEVGAPLGEALGIAPDVVFDLTVEGNRPDAWCIAGVARDLAARLQVPFALPEPVVAEAGPDVGSLARAAVESPEMCPRLTVRVAESVTVGPSSRRIASRLLMAGMRPINNVVDASNYVMLELGQPTHPYDLDRLGAPGLLVRRASRGEVVTTLDGVERELGVPGRGLGETGEDCVIADADGTPVGIGGIFGGSSSEISAATTRVLLEAAYFDPMTIARTSKRLKLRTEASARFERGTDPLGIDRSTDRFWELVLESSPGAVVAKGTLDVRGELGARARITLATERVNALLGTGLGTDEIAGLLTPIGFDCAPDGGGALSVTVPTNRPDVRPEPNGVADLAEEVARIYGYARIARRQPTWTEPGGLSTRQKDRRRVREVLVGLGANEAWTPSLVDDDLDRRVGSTVEPIRVTNPMAADQATLRRTQMAGLLRSLVWNLDRRQGDIRLFEVGTVFGPPSGRSADGERAGAGGAQQAALPTERELLSALFAADGDDASVAVAALRVLAEALAFDDLRIRPPVGGAPLPGLHPSRSARVLAGSEEVAIGTVGEIDPAVVAEFGAGEVRVGWLELDLGPLLDPTVVTRGGGTTRPVSRYPSSDVDLALVVDDAIPADAVADVLKSAGGELLESVTLFDVYRGPGVESGRRSLGFRLRFCADDRTLTDREVGGLRTACVEAASREVGAALRSSDGG
ncbi:MAG: phenylalanine--tRNA ligase subunit beta [Acidimicrobiales bacterium]